MTMKPFSPCVLVILLAALLETAHTPVFASSVGRRSSIARSSSQKTFLPPDDHRFAYIGRWQLEENTAKADWPCSSIQLSMTRRKEGALTNHHRRHTVDASSLTSTSFPTTVTLRLKLSRVRANVVVTNAETGRVETETVLEGSSIFGRTNNYDLQLENVSPGTTYTFTLRKLTQAAPFNNGIGRHLKSVLEFHGIELSEDLHILPPPPPPSRRIQMIGASDTAGFCVDGTPETRDGMMKPWKYDNCDATSHAVYGRRFDAETSVAAIAGIGLTQNAFANTPFLLGKNTMPDFYQRTLQTQEKPHWDFVQWRPDVVVVSLGGNDFNHQKKIPENDTFIEAYQEFLLQIFYPYLHDASPEAVPTIVSICGQGDPTESARDPNNDRCRPCPHVQEATEAFQRKYADTVLGKNVHYLFIPCDGSVVTGVDDIGCEGHKNRLGQERIADFLEPKLRDIMGWHENDLKDNNESEASSYQQMAITLTCRNDQHFLAPKGPMLLLYILSSLLIATAGRAVRSSTRNQGYIKATAIVVEMEDDMEKQIS